MTNGGGTGMQIPWHYLWYAAAALALMVVAIVGGDLWLLNFMHVFTGLLWTGIDLFLGFVLGPIMRTLDLPTRKAIAAKLTPRTMFLMPTVSIVAGTTGWFLADQMGLNAMPWPQYGWVAAALVLLGLMTVVGLGFLTPTNVLVCIELHKPDPDMAKVGRWMRRYFFLAAAQGVMQILTVVIMARFRVGL
ncbi:MAG: hypothetical protein FJX62_02830 [Alphaproteobacteria bacterium]|nr:hypothetical protein [Alphaproteobacteria bacterium]